MLPVHRGEWSKAKWTATPLSTPGLIDETLHLFIPYFTLAIYKLTLDLLPFHIPLTLEHAETTICSNKERLQTQICVRGGGPTVLQYERNAQCAFKLISMDSAEQHNAAHRWACEPSNESSSKTKHNRLILEMGNSLTWDSIQMAFLVFTKWTHWGLTSGQNQDIYSKRHNYCRWVNGILWLQKKTHQE